MHGRQVKLNHRVCTSNCLEDAAIAVYHLCKLSFWILIAMPSDSLFTGFSRDDDSPIELDTKTLLRHFMALGSSGSGKTVLSKIVVEEMVRDGIPAICIDPQGDLCSLALNADNPQALADKGVDPALAREFADKADVVVFTPASHKGVPLCADPIQVDPGPLNARERMHAFTATATMVVSLLGYDLGSDDGEGLVAVFDKCLNLLFERELFPANLAQFTAYWSHLEAVDRELYSRYLNDKKIDQACRKLARLDVGARRLLFHDGHPLNIELLLGRDKSALPGKTRVSVIYLNTLHSQEDKEYFVAALVQQLYTWMLDNPSKAPQALFYIDEVAPYIPPVRKPACKDGLSLLFKQARKYGVSCLMATQNPADVDYKAMAQFGSWALGRLTTRQDLKKVQPTVKSLDPVHVDAVMAQLPAQRPGEFLLISPDNFDHTRPIRSRWLYTEHETLDEDRIEQLTRERWLQRFPVPGTESQQVTQTPEPEQPAAPTQDTTASTNPTGTAEQAAASEPGQQTETASGKDQQLDAKLQRQLDLLATAASMTTSEFAQRASVSDSTARKSLKHLVHAGLAGQFKQGRSNRYWAKANGLRPDLGLTDKVKTIQPLIDAKEAERIGNNLRERKMLGIIGDDEELYDARLEYRPLLRVHFREKVRRSFWKRLFSRNQYEQRVDSVYLHPQNLKLVVFNNKEGLSLHQRPQDLASQIEDFDNVAKFEQRVPAELPIDEHDWHQRQSDDTVIKHLGSLYQARLQTVEPVFLPLWRLHFRVPGQAGARILTIDALSGFTLDWLS